VDAEVFTQVGWPWSLQLDFEYYRSGDCKQAWQAVYQNSSEMTFLQASSGTVYIYPPWYLDIVAFEQSIILPRTALT
jgi:hypothetical protein